MRFKEPEIFLLLSEIAFLEDKPTYVPPMKAAAALDTIPQPAVIPTRPPKMPEIKM